MRIVRWSVEGYKSLEEAEIEVSDINTLLGKNNSGKSNIINSFRDYKKIVTGRPNYTWITSKITRGDEFDSTRFEVRLELAEDEQERLSEFLRGKGIGKRLRSVELSELKHHVEVDDGGQIIDESILILYRDEWIHAQFWDDNVQRSLKWRQLPDTDYVGRGANSNRGISGVFNDILQSSVRGWKFVDSFRKIEDHLPSQYTEELDSDGTNLVQVLDTLSDNDEDRFAEIAETYVSIMEGVTAVETPFLPDQGRNQSTIAVREENFSDSFNAEEISAGSKEILTLITQIYLAEQETDLLLLEEPELHLHPEAEQHIFDVISDIAGEDGPQVIVSTHSDVFVNQSEVSNLIRVERDGMTTLREVQQEDSWNVLTDLGYSKSGLLQSDAVVFVEGLSDKLILSEWTNTLGLDIESEGVSIVELEGEGNVATHGRSLVKLLQSFGIPYLFVIDSDDSDARTVIDEYKRQINREDDDDIDESSIWWYTTPDHFYAWSDSDIEKLLLQDPEAIGAVVGEDRDTIQQIITETESEVEDNVEVLEKIWDECYVDPDGVTSYQKDVDGRRIAKHMTEGQMDEEIVDVVEQIESLLS